MSKETSNDKFRKSNLISPIMLQELLLKNQINKSKSPLYTKLNKRYGAIRDELYKKTGLTLIKVGESYKLQLPSKSHEVITKNDDSLTYKMFLLISAYIITKDINEPFLQAELYDEIRFEINELEESDKERLFKNVLKYMIDENYLSLTKEFDDNFGEFRILRKIKDSFITNHEPNRYRVTKLAKITNILFLNQTLDKSHYPDLFGQKDDPESITNADLKEYFEQFHDEENGYDVIFDGNIIRLIGFNDKKGFPNMNNAKHRVLADILSQIQENPDDKNIENLIKTSKYYQKDVTLQDIKDLIDEYNLLQLKIKKG